MNLPLEIKEKGFSSHTYAVFTVFIYFVQFNFLHVGVDLASYADILWARHAIFLPHERLLKRMGCLIRPITAHCPIKAANFEFSRAKL